MITDEEVDFAFLRCSDSPLSKQLSIIILCGHTIMSTNCMVE